MAEVASRNPFALLGDDGDDGEAAPAPKAPAKSAAKPSPAPAAEAPKAERQADRAPREDRRRGGYGRGGSAGGEGRDRNVPPRLARQENGEGVTGPAEGRENGRGGYRGRGRGFRGGDRGGRGRGGRGREFDRHSATGRVDSEKQEVTGGWGAAGAEAEGAVVEAVEQVAPAESKTEEAAPPKEKTPEEIAAEEERRKEEEEHRKEEEALAKLKTLDQYLAEREANKATLEGVNTAPRSINAGVDPNLLKSNKKFERKEDEDVFYAGKTKTGAPKPKAQKEQKQAVDIEFRFAEEPRRGGRGGRGGGDRPFTGRGRGVVGDRPFSGRGGGRGRGERGNVNTADPNAFPTLK